MIPEYLANYFCLFPHLSCAIGFGIESYGLFRFGILVLYFCYSLAGNQEKPIWCFQGVFPAQWGKLHIIIEYLSLPPFLFVLYFFVSMFPFCSIWNLLRTSKVAIKEYSNSAPVPETKSEEPAQESAAPTTVPDVSTISAFMTQVADIVECVKISFIHSQDVSIAEYMSGTIYFHH